MLIFIACFSCTPYMVPHRIKREFYCYNGQPTGIDSLININGYFTTREGIDDTAFVNYIFFNDGIFILSV